MALLPAYLQKSVNQTQIMSPTLLCNHSCSSPLRARGKTHLFSFNIMNNSLKSDSNLMDWHSGVLTEDYWTQVGNWQCNSLFCWGFKVNTSLPAASGSTVRNFEHLDSFAFSFLHLIFILYEIFCMRMIKEIKSREFPSVIIQWPLFNLMNYESQHQLF